VLCVSEEEDDLIPYEEGKSLRRQTLRFRSLCSGGGKRLLKPPVVQMSLILLGKAGGTRGSKRPMCRRE
jgi:hypothetical protein